MLPADRPKFGNAMPAFDAVLSDVEVADLASFLRRTFATDASPIDADRVARRRRAP